MSSDREGNDSFAALFEQSAKEPLRRKPPRVGEMLECVVVQVGRDTVFVELDGKRQAFIEASELRAADGTIPLQVGATIRARVVDVEQETGNVRLGVSMGKPNDVAGLEQAREAGLPVEGKVTKVNKGGLEIDIAGVRAFCPSSQVEARFVQDLNAYVGKSLSFLVTEIKDNGRSVTLSRRRLLEREGRENAERVLKDLRPGVTVRGTVTGVREFGAFVDLGGIEGMIPASEIAHDRSVNVQSAVSVGDVVDVQVREIKDATNKRSGEPEKKITLSLKALAQDPWEGIDASISAGKVARGTVTRVVEFGAFVKLTAGVEGLLHRSEIGGRGTLPKAGDTLDVVVQSIDKNEKKISLTLAPEGFSAGASVPETKLAVGAVVSGVIDRIETYGVFVQVDGTKGRAGRGLIPNVELGVPRGTDVRKTFPEGTKVTAKVIDVADGKIRLSIRAAKDAAERADFEGYREKSSAPGKAGSLGTLGDLLAKHAAKPSKK